MERGRERERERQWEGKGRGARQIARETNSEEAREGGSKERKQQEMCVRTPWNKGARKRVLKCLCNEVFVSLITILFERICKVMENTVGDFPRSLPNLEILGIQTCVILRHFVTSLVVYRRFAYLKNRVIFTTAE